MRLRNIAVAMVVAFASVTATEAATYIVDARINSALHGVGVATFELTNGQSFALSSAADDLWSAGESLRYSNGDGLVRDYYATSFDDSAQTPGTLIGQYYDDFVFAGLSAPHGSLVGEIGGVYQHLGANFRGVAWGTGVLNLFYWDSIDADNVGSISFSSGAVPEPNSWVMLIAGFGLIGIGLRRRRDRGRTYRAVQPH